MRAPFGIAAAPLGCLALAALILGSPRAAAGSSARESSGLPAPAIVSAPEFPPFAAGAPIHTPASLSLALAPAALGPVTVAGDGAAGDGPAAGEAPLALATAFAPAPQVGVRISGGRNEKPRKPSNKPQRSRASRVALTPERAQALLRSITFPGWGQATLGHTTSATVFAIAETGIWGTFVAFRLQEHLRKDAAANNARLFAGIDLRGRDEEFLRLVGAFASSDEYNLLVVSRDAANQLYDDPVAYRAYIAQHSLGGHDSWSWQDPASFFRYGAQRRDAQRASLRANTSLALAIGNRLLSMLHVARLSGKPRPSAIGSWNFEVVPAGGNDPTAFRYGVRARF